MTRVPSMGVSSPSLTAVRTLLAALEASMASLIAGSGIEGDRYQRGTGKYSEIEDIREVTLIEIETLEVSLPI